MIARARSPISSTTRVRLSRAFRGSIARRRLAGVVVSLAALMTVAAPAAAEPSGTVTFSVSSAPMLGQPATITVSGTSSQAGELASFVSLGSSRCPLAERLEQVQLSSLGAPMPVPQGSYSLSFQLTPLYPGNRLLCGYLFTPSGDDLIYAQGSGSFLPAGAGSGAPSAPSGSASPGANTTPAPHLTTLKVKVQNHPGRTFAKPGLTDIVIDTQRAFHVRVKLKRRGHTATKTPAWGSSSSQGTVAVPWTCAQPGGTYSYTVTVTDSYNKTLSRNGEFRPVTVARCRALKTKRHGRG